MCWCSNVPRVEKSGDDFADMIFFSGDSLCPLLASRRLLCRFRVEIVSAAGDNGCQMLEMWNRLMEEIQNKYKYIEKN